MAREWDRLGNERCAPGVGIVAALPEQVGVVECRGTQRQHGLAPTYGLAELRASLYPRGRNEAPEPVAKVTRAVPAASAGAARLLVPWEDAPWQ